MTVSPTSDELRNSNSAGGAKMDALRRTGGMCSIDGDGGLKVLEVLRRYFGVNGLTAWRDLIL